MIPPSKPKRGFAAMDPDRQREIARAGGKAVPADKRSFAQNPDLASQAGRKGGLAVAPANRSFARDPGLASKAGKKGGLALSKKLNEGITKVPESQD